MRELTFNKKSIHFWLATKVADYQPPSTYTYEDGYVEVTGDSGDICTYSKHVFGGAVMVLLTTLLGVGLSSMIIHMALGIYFSLMYNMWLFTVLGEVSIAMCTVIIFFVSCWYITNKVNKYLRKRRNDRINEDSFGHAAYTSWKNKFCVPIKFND